MIVLVLQSFLAVSTVTQLFNPSVATVSLSVNVTALVVVPTTYSSMTLLFNGPFDHCWTSVWAFYGSDGGLPLSACEFPKGISKLYDSFHQYKSVQKLCVCILHSVSVSVEILSYRAVKVLECNVSNLYQHYSPPLLSTFWTQCTN